jgi:solute carrier family 50 protein (sugar transporter)
MLQFTKYAPKQSPTFPGSVMGHIQGCVAFVLLTVGMALTLSKPAPLVGNLGVVLCVAMFGSPLAALKTVVSTKSAESIPLPFTLASVLNCFLWTVVGILDMNDVNIYVPNVLGLTFGLIQVGLKLVYGSAKKNGFKYGEAEMLPL